MKYFAILLMAVSFNSSAISVIDHLKSVPATKYEIGYVQLSLFSFLLNERLKGEPVPNSDFDYGGTKVYQDDFHLGVEFSFVGRSKYLTQNTCAQHKVMVEKIFDKSALIKDIWSGLTAEQYTKLESEFPYVVTLIDESNSNLRINCGKP
ncbi:hypothetical protein [Pseudoalteromonas piscicida]|uniref:Uncharacterized protein n=1 Tax=Pseudoalteromonas piscicida TaxID=43662 RepID=A0AAD0RJN0_PSEO7|nr:hypothetical protein [Pseudoalteromonas piscicida]ASD68514.1 hypothetical protein B1L02_16830 [Pseudoalteromonas piscicida]AXR03571.1 hypothetical protein D0511_16905 [Pseudoalteromonas piscicida]